MKEIEQLVSNSQREGIAGPYLTDTCNKEKQARSHGKDCVDSAHAPLHLILTLSVPATILS